MAGRDADLLGAPAVPPPSSSPRPAGWVYSPPGACFNWARRCGRVAIPCPLGRSFAAPCRGLDWPPRRGAVDAPPRRAGPPTTLDRLACLREARGCGRSTSLAESSREFTSFLGLLVVGAVAVCAVLPPERFRWANRPSQPIAPATASCRAATLRPGFAAQSVARALMPLRARGEM